MQKKTTVSVLMLTADHHAPFIKEAIESVLVQAFQDWELIILDDGKKYEVEPLVKLYKDSRISYSKQEHRGPEFIADSYNKMLSEANGEYIAILEGDDRWSEYTLEVQLNALKKNSEAIICYGRLKIIDEYNNEILELPVSDMLQHRDWLYNDPIGNTAEGLLLYGIFIAQLTLMMKKETIQKIGGFRKVNGLYTTDGPTIFELAFEGKFYFIDRILGYSRWHRKSLSHIKDHNVRLGSLIYFISGIGKRNLIIDTQIRRKALIRWGSFIRFSYFLAGRYFLFKKEFMRAGKCFRKLLRGNIGEKIKGIFGIILCDFKIHYIYEALYLFFTHRDITGILAEAIDFDLLGRAENYLDKLK